MQRAPRAAPVSAVTDTDRTRVQTSVSQRFNALRAEVYRIDQKGVQVDTGKDASFSQEERKVSTFILDTTKTQQIRTLKLISLTFNKQLDTLLALKMQMSQILLTAYLPDPSVNVTILSTPATLKFSTLPLGQCTSIASTDVAGPNPKCGLGSLVER